MIDWLLVFLGIALFFGGFYLAGGWVYAKGKGDEK